MGTGKNKFKILYIYIVDNKDMLVNIHRTFIFYR